MAAKYRNHGDTITLPYEAGTTPGQLKSVAGLIGVRQGISTPAEGEAINWGVNAIVEIDAPSSLVLADGADARVDLTTQNAVASGGVVAGKCVGGKANGQTTVFILLNR